MPTWTVQSYSHFEYCFVCGVQHGSFHAAAQALNLIRSDECIYQTFDNLVTLRMPPQLPEAFANMHLTYTISNELDFWNRYKNEMIGDFRRMPDFSESTDEELFN